MSITNIAVESHTVSSYLAHILFDQNRRAECAADVRKGINPGVIEPWPCKSDFQCWEHQVEGDNCKEGPMARAQARQRLTSTEPKRGGIKIYN